MSNLKELGPSRENSLNPYQIVIDMDLWVKIFPRVNIQTSQTIVTEYKTKDNTQFYSETNHNTYNINLPERV